MAADLRVYDVNTDEYRPVTQLDLDMFQATVQAYGKLRAATASTHAQLMRDIDDIKSRAQPAAEPDGMPHTVGDAPDGRIGYG